MASPNTPLQAMQSFFKKMRVVGIIIAVIMIILGILMFVAPIRTTVVVSYLFLVGIIIYGVFDIVKYFRAPGALRQPWSLACGIICALLGIIVFLQNICSIGEGGNISSVYMLSVALCFSLVVSGIGRLTTASAFKKDGAQHTGWLTASGVIDIILAVFFISTPFTMTFIYEWIMGIYAVVAGVTLLAELLSDPLDVKHA